MSETNEQNRTSVVGQKFGRWLVLDEGPRRVRPYMRYRMMVCRCDCGTERIVRLDSLRRGLSSSCGCYHRDLSRRRMMRQRLKPALGKTRKEKLEPGCTKHGHTVGGESPTYITWHNMIQRCTNAAATSYQYYGGRGIRVCERWRKFENFLEDMGERPMGLTLDREDNDGNYEPGNCRWATRKEQQHNTRRTL